MKLKDLFKDIVPIVAFPDVEISSVVGDSRQVKNKSLFFALAGSMQDGSAFMAAAAEGGAAAIVCDVSVSEVVPLAVPVIRVADARKVLAKVAARFFGNASDNLYLCGVTGTNGKTTITYLLEHIWSPSHTGVIGTVNFRYTGYTQPATNTTPDAITVQRLLADMVASHTTQAVMEVSSHGLTQSRATACSFDSAVFTNLTQDHLDYHRDMDDYYQAKRKLFVEELATSPKQNKLAVIGIDDAYGQRLLNDLPKDAFAIKAFATEHQNADVCLLSADYSIRGTVAKIRINQEELTLKTNLIGAHNLRNILAALTVAQHGGADMSCSLQKMETVSVPGRLERVGQSLCFVDYAHTPDALHNVITAIKQILTSDNTRAKLIVVFGCGGDRDKSKRPLMGAVTAGLADIAIVTSDNPRTENPDDIIRQIMVGVEKHAAPYDGTKGFLTILDRKTAIHRALEIANPNDVILIAGKGHEDYQIIGKEKIHFDDREVVREILRTKTRSNENTRDKPCC